MRPRARDYTLKKIRRARLRLSPFQGSHRNEEIKVVQVESLEPCPHPTNTTTPSSSHSTSVNVPFAHAGPDSHNHTKAFSFPVSHLHCTQHGFYLHCQHRSRTSTTRDATHSRRRFFLLPRLAKRPLDGAIRARRHRRHHTLLHLSTHPRIHFALPAQLDAQGGASNTFGGKSQNDSDRTFGQARCGRRTTTTTTTRG